MSVSRQWRVLGASVRGTSHEKIGRGCDDAHRYLQLENGTLLIAVADGAGTASRSSEGASCAVQTACDRAAAMLAQHAEFEEQGQWEELLLIVLKSVRAELEACATRARVPLAEAAQQGASADAPSLREFATTLLFLIASRHWLAAVQIGDGAIVVQHADGKLEALPTADSSEYLDETNFVTNGHYLDAAHYFVLREPDIRHIALFSDGLSLLALNFPTNTPHAPFFAPLFTFAGGSGSEDDLVSFLRSERVCKRTDDDKTLVLAVWQ
jgi:hypothetical protein